MEVLSKKLKEIPCTCALCKEGVFSGEKSYYCKLVRAIRTLLDKFEYIDEEDNKIKTLEHAPFIHFSNVEQQKVWFIHFTDESVDDFECRQLEDLFDKGILYPEAVYITYYKSRGSTEQIYFLYESDTPPTLPTKRQLEFLLVVLERVFEVNNTDDLDSKIEAAKDTWKDVDAEKYMNEVRGED